VSSNRFEVLKVRVIQRGEESSKKVAKNRKEILREEKAKRGVDATKEKKEKNVERSSSKNWVETGRRQRGSSN